MSELIQLLIFRLEEQRCALLLEAVERVIRAAEVTPLPGAPATVIGVLDVAGDALPVLSLRRRFGLADRATSPTDEFIIARAGQRRVILVVDTALTLTEAAGSEVTGAAEVAPGLEQFRGVVKTKDGIILLYDLEKFLSLDETAALERAMHTKTSA